MHFVGSGSKLLTCSSDKTARCVKLPIAKCKGECISYLGHNASVKSIDSNNDLSLALSSGEDQRAIVWDFSSGEQLFCIDKVEHNLKQSKEALTPFGASIDQAKFYYQDKFILLNAQNVLYLYKYKIESEQEKKKQANDIKK
jgi:WD40 repeat protein